MGRQIVQMPREDWRERLFWTALAGGLIALMLGGLIALAEWGELAEEPVGVRVAAQPGSTGLMADLLIPPPAPPTPFAVPLPQLPAVGAAPAAGPDPLPECGEVAVAVAWVEQPLVAVSERLCAPSR